MRVLIETEAVAVAVALLNEELNEFFGMCAGLGVLLKLPLVGLLGIILLQEPAVLAMLLEEYLCVLLFILSLVFVVVLLDLTSVHVMGHLFDECLEVQERSIQAW